MEAFERVVRELCAEVGVDEADQVVATSEILIDGLAVQFMPSDEDGEGMVVFADLGIPDEVRRPEVHRMLLEGNLMWNATGGGVLGVHPQTGAVGLSAGVRLDGIDGRALSEIVARFVTVAEYWVGIVHAPLDGGAAGTSGAAPDAFIVRG